MIAVVFVLCWAFVFAIIVIIRYKAKYDQSSIEADHWKKLHILMKSDRDFYKKKYVETTEYQTIELVKKSLSTLELSK